MEIHIGLNAELEPAGMVEEVLFVEIFYEDGTSEIVPV
jgi:hypothetical protein